MHSVVICARIAGVLLLAQDGHQVPPVLHRAGAASASRSGERLQVGRDQSAARVSSRTSRTGWSALGASREKAADSAIVARLQAITFKRLTKPVTSGPGSRDGAFCLIPCKPLWAEVRGKRMFVAAGSLDNLVDQL